MVHDSTYFNFKFQISNSISNFQIFFVDIITVRIWDLGSGIESRINYSFQVEVILLYVAAEHMI